VLQKLAAQYKVPAAVIVILLEAGARTVWLWKPQGQLLQLYGHFFPQHFSIFHCTLPLSLHVATLPYCTAFRCKS